AARYLDRVLLDFRRSGVDQDAAARAELKALADRGTELGIEFGRRIREGARAFRLAPAQLDGLPQDFVDAHPPDDDGLVALSTDYPDSVPVIRYATDPEARRAAALESALIAW